ncbi:hypothetical protein F2Q68_00017268 [Brassica cretica]|uniref:Uncharacterized protein n=1 Tax=Brassica cretica TaxID=69181 RepID=A0A8S9HBW9_BRACR|nr:hypothetical protein F2Q68_00017268 [Brassica cretica]
MLRRVTARETPQPTKSNQLTAGALSSSPKIATAPRTMISEQRWMHGSAGVSQQVTPIPTSAQTVTFEINSTQVHAIFASVSIV